MYWMGMLPLAGCQKCLPRAWLRPINKGTCHSSAADCFLLPIHAGNDLRDSHRNHTAYLLLNIDLLDLDFISMILPVVLPDFMSLSVIPVAL
jgi:hypothetical protein